jgi:CheY-like chemotaxis protein
MVVCAPAATCRTVPEIRAVLPADEDRPPATASSAPVHLTRSPWLRWRQRPSEGPLPSLQGRTILVIDDDADALELLRLVLESCGARVLAAASTMHARGYLHSLTPDLIVCDLALPREDGITFIRGLRATKDPAIARVPAIAVTAFYEDYPPTRAQEFAAYFQKPIDIDALTRTIASLLPPATT